MRFDLLPQFLEGLTEKFFHLTAAKAYDVRVLSLHPRFVEMLVSFHVHQVKLIDQTPGFQHLESPVDGDAVQLGIDGLGAMKKLLSIQVFTGFIDQVQEDLPLASQPDAFLLEGVPDALASHETYPDFTMSTKG